MKGSVLWMTLLLDSSCFSLSFDNYHVLVFHLTGTLRPVIWLSEFAHTLFLAGDTLAAGAYYEKAVAILKGKKDYGVDYVKTLQGWGSLEAQARNSSRARSLFQECVRVSEKVTNFSFTLISVIRL